MAYHATIGCGRCRFQKNRRPLRMKPTRRQALRKQFYAAPPAEESSDNRRDLIEGGEKGVHVGGPHAALNGMEERYVRLLHSN